MRVLSIFLLLVTLPVMAQQDTETVEPLTVIVGANNAPPYRILEHGQHTGLYVDIFEEISARLGWKVRYREAPFRRVLRMVRLGEVDVMLGPLQTEEREKIMEFVAPAFPPERRLFFYVDETNRVERYSDLYGKRIGVLAGASYFPRFDGDEELVKEPAPRYENLMRMLQKGRVDIVIAPELIGTYTINQLGMDISVSAFFVPGERSYIAVAKSSPVAAYADDIRAAFKLIEMEGIYEDLVLKYMERPAP